MAINTSFSMIIIVCFASMILFSCESHEQKADEAFDIVKEGKMLSKDSSLNNVQIINEPKEKEVVKKDEHIDEWLKFRNETEKKMLANEKKIKVIENIPNANSKLKRQVTSLQKDNNDLKRQMDEYKEDVKLKWENFKLKINHDVDVIDIELKDMTLNNVKSKK